MENRSPNLAEADSHEENTNSLKVSKKPYVVPTLQRYGGLAELVQLRPDRGRDGETRWIDCTSG